MEKDTHDIGLLLVLTSLRVIKFTVHKLEARIVTIAIILTGIKSRALLQRKKHSNKNILTYCQLHVVLTSELPSKYLLTTEVISP
jgi:hypothetical protein